MKQTIKDIIEEKFGTVNKFLDENHHKLSISRTHFYKLINPNDFNINPTLKTLLEIADILKIDEDLVINEFKAKIRRAEEQS